jgi:hypothetical protein
MKQTKDAIIKAIRLAKMKNQEHPDMILSELNNEIGLHPSE